MDEAAPGGLVREAEGRAFFEGHEIGKGIDVALIDGHHFRVSTPRHRREDPLAEADFRHARSDATDDPGHLAARAERELGAVLVLALDDQDVGVVAADRPDSNTTSPGFGRGTGPSA